MWGYSRGIVYVQLDDDEVCDVRDVMRGTVAKVGRVCATHCAVGEL